MVSSVSNNPFVLDIYTIDPGAGSLTRIDSITNYVGLTFFSLQNGAGLATFQLPGMSEKASGANLKRFGNVVAIKMNSTIVWVGFIETLKPAYAGENYIVNVECREYFAHLASRYTGESVRFNGVDAGQIAMQLITTTQSQTYGNLLITEGVITPTFERDREYQNKSIADAIIDLTEVENGFDFTLQPVTVGDVLTGFTFNVQQEIGQYRPNVPALSLGGNVISFSAMTRQDIYNNIKYKGAGNGEQVLLAEANSLDSMASYTRREKFVSRDDISIESTLQQHADADLDAESGEVYYFDIDVRPDSNLPYGSFNIGDSVNLSLTIPDMTMQFSGVALIESIECDVDNLGVLNYSCRAVLS